MEFLANENFPKPSIQILRSAGFSVESISETRPGISDTQVIEVAVRKNLTIITFDKDYGEIIFKQSISKPPAVIFFRFKGNNPLHAGEKLLDLLQQQSFEFSGKFTVIEKESVRQRLYQSKLK